MGGFEGLKSEGGERIPNSEKELIQLSEEAQRFLHTHKQKLQERFEGKETVEPSIHLDEEYLQIAALVHGVGWPERTEPNIDVALLERVAQGIVEDIRKGEKSSKETQAFFEKLPGSLAKSQSRAGPSMLMLPKIALLKEVAPQLFEQCLLPYRLEIKNIAVERARYSFKDAHQEVFPQDPIEPPFRHGVLNGLLKTFHETTILTDGKFRDAIVVTATIEAAERLEKLLQDRERVEKNLQQSQFLQNDYAEEVAGLGYYLQLLDKDSFEEQFGSRREEFKRIAAMEKTAGQWNEEIQIMIAKLQTAVITQNK